MTPERFKELRALARDTVDPGLDGFNGTAGHALDEALDEIERLRAEVARLALELAMQHDPEEVPLLERALVALTDHAPGETVLIEDIRQCLDASLGGER